MVQSTQTNHMEIQSRHFIILRYQKCKYMALSTLQRPYSPTTLPLSYNQFPLELYHPFHHQTNFLSTTDNVGLPTDKTLIVKPRSTSTAPKCIISDKTVGRLDMLHHQIYRSRSVQFLGKLIKKKRFIGAHVFNHVCCGSLLCHHNIGE